MGLITGKRSIRQQQHKQQPIHVIGTAVCPLFDLRRPRDVKYVELTPSRTGTLYLIPDTVSTGPQMRNRDVGFRLGFLSLEKVCFTPTSVLTAKQVLTYPYFLGVVRGSCI